MLNIGLRSRIRKLSPSSISKASQVHLRDALIVDWVNRGPVAANWGDRIAPHIVRFFTGRPVVNNRDVLNLARHDVYTTIGSMLGTVRGGQVHVWGTGFVSSDARLRCRPTIHAVRGPRTAEMLERQGVPCPEVFGDPALFVPRMFDRSAEKTHELGLIPHWKERGLPVVARLAAHDNVKIIDICAGLEAVVQEITSCERIATAALHGMVCADAFLVPTVPLVMSDRPAGSGFKLHDYLEGSGRSGLELVRVTDRTTADELMDQDWNRPPTFKLEEFEAACPLPASP